VTGTPRTLLGCENAIGLDNSLYLHSRHTVRLPPLLRLSLSTPLAYPFPPHTPFLT